MNWNPGLFAHKYTTHTCWSQAAGPVKDLYNVGENPQFRLELPGRRTTATIWVLLSRHITTIDDFAHNREYITCHVYRGGERVHYPQDHLIQGTKINSPHYLVKLDVEPGELLLCT